MNAYQQLDENGDAGPTILALCPFCGAEAYEEALEDRAGGWWFECSDCETAGPTCGSAPPGTADFSVEALEAWNMRPVAAIIASLGQLDRPALEALAVALDAALSEVAS